jgi:hypothetical protein
MADNSPKAWNIVGVLATVVGMVFGKVLSLTILIPMIFAALAHFGATQIIKRLVANGKIIGGFGLSDSSTAPFELAVSIVTGHLLWGALGLALS